MITDSIRRLQETVIDADYGKDIEDNGGENWSGKDEDKTANRIKTGLQPAQRIE